jgi:hypothetical protein
MSASVHASRPRFAVWERGGSAIAVLVAAYVGVRLPGLTFVMLATAAALTTFASP